jgi:hypothetical protein
MGKVETHRFSMDPETAGFWEKVKGDLHVRLRETPSNARAVSILSRLYLDLDRHDPSALARAIERLALEERGYRV